MSATEVVVYSLNLLEMENLASILALDSQAVAKRGISCNFETRNLVSKKTRAMVAVWMLLTNNPKSGVSVPRFCKVSFATKIFPYLKKKFLRFWEQLL
jgi:hypothetical protein